MFGRVNRGPGVHTVRQLKLKKIVAATALALSSAVLVSPAYAAGLGRINVTSGLGQPLRAEIDLTSVSREEAGSLAARLGSPAAYRDAGRDFNASLLNVRMAVERRADGQYFVRLTSNTPVNDPIVDLLVELTWANGRLLREYTFLLDPVDMRPAQPPEPPPAAPEPKPVPPVVQPAPAPAPAPVATPVPIRPTAQPKAAPASGSYEVKKGDTAGKIARRALADGVTLDQMLIAIQRANQDAFIGGNVNRLKSGVILSIPDREAAAAVAPADANRLVAAQSADWKSYSEKLATGAQAAPVAKPAPEKREARGRITARVEDKATPGATGDQLRLSKADPAAAAKGAPKPRAGTEDRISKERELRDAKARQAELERNVKDLQKLAEIKNQSLADLQKGAQAKGPQVAQGPVTVPPAAPAKAAPPKAAPTAAVAAPAPAVATKPLETPKAEAPKAALVPAPGPAQVPAAAAKAADKAPEPAKAADPAKVPAAKPVDPPKAADATALSKGDVPKVDAPGVDASKADASKADAPKADAPKADAPKADAPKADAPKANAPKVDAKPESKKAAPPPPPPKPEPSLADEFLDNPLYLAGGGGVLALLGGYAAYAVRRKRKDAATGFQNSIVTGGDLKANSVFGNTGGQSIDTGNSSFQSDFSTSGSAAVDTDEVDPVAEADVYMAYGRDAQAEEILKEALQKDPNRQTVRMKLLEIYSQRGDAASFGNTANELHVATGGVGEQWERAAALGKSIDPANSLYGGGAGAAALAGGDSMSTVALAGGSLAAAASAAASANDKTVTMPVFGGPGAATLSADDPSTKTVALESMQGQTPASIDLDFDLGGDSAVPAAAAPDLGFNVAASSQAAPSIDFDLGFGDAPAAPAPAAPPPVAAAPAPPSDFAPQGTLIIDAPIAQDSGLGPADKTMELAPAGAAAPQADAGMSVDFDFDLGSSAPAAPMAAAVEPAAAPAAGGNGIDFDFGSVSLDLPDAGGSTEPAPSDDVATKLDLAKAYQEMGDKDGAKELLREVLAEGNSAQKAEAQKLISGLG